MTDSRRCSVLLVDDHVDTREAYATYLEWVGYSPTTAGSGEEALAIAARVQPDVIVIDMRLPGMNGLSVIRKLEADASTSAIPVIVLTGSDVRTLQDTTAVARMLQKPLLPQDLLASIKAVLGAVRGASASSTAAGSTSRADR